MSDGNENVGDAMSAVLAAKPLGVTVDVVPMAWRASTTYASRNCRCLPN